MDTKELTTKLSNANAGFIRLFIVSFILVIYIGLLAPLWRTVTAAPVLQGNHVFTISNESNEIICKVFISPTNSDSWGEDWLAESELIASGKQRSFEVESGTYDLILFSCEDVSLVTKFGIVISDSLTITLEQRDVCQTLNEAGLHQYSQSDFAGSIKTFEGSVSCLQSTSDRMSEGRELNNLGLSYQALGRYAEALEKFEQALSIAQEMDDMAAEGVALNNIGLNHDVQGRYQVALEVYTQALVIVQGVGNRESEAGTLDNIGGVNQMLGRYDLALENYNQALAIRREVGERLGEGTTLNNIGTAYFALSQYDDAQESFEQALSIAKEVGDRAGEGIMNANIGGCLHEQGRYAEALEKYKKALVITQEIGNRPGEGKALDKIGSVYLAQGLYDEALESFEQALVIAKEVGDRSGEGTTTDNMGSFFMSLGHFDLALESFEQALVIRRELGERRNQGVTLYNIGSVYLAQGRYGIALESFEQSLALTREFGDRAGEGEVLNNIGLVYEIQGLYEKALENFEQARVIAVEVNNFAGEAIALLNLGGVYETIGPYHAAMTSYEQALNIAVGLGDRLTEGRVLNSMGLYHLENDNFEEALMEVEKALRIFHELGNRMDEGRAYNNIGGIYQMQGGFDQALESYKQALTIAEEIGDKAGQVWTLSNMGTVFYFQGQYDEALNHYDQALTKLESVRAVSGTEEARAKFLEQNSSLFEATIDLYLTNDQAEEAFFTSERARARTFLDAMATGYVQLDNQEMQHIIEQEQTTYRTLQTVKDALNQARTQDPVDSNLVSTLESDLTKAQMDHEDAMNNITANGSRVGSLFSSRELKFVLDVHKVQAQLPTDTTLVSYYLYTDPDGEEHVVGFVLTQNEFDTVPLPVTVEQLALEIRDFLNFSNTNNPHPVSLRQLYTWLIAPLQDSITTNNLIIVPHVGLHYLPFAALSDGEQYLGDQYVISTLPSASILPLLADSYSQIGNPLVLGNPINNAGQGGLPAAEREATSIAALFDETAYLGSMATESLVRKQAGNHSILHIAAHSEFNHIAPLQSHLLLAADEQNDGLLHMAEVYELDLEQTDLVVLSACESNIGKVSRGDDIVALNRAFLFAGAPTVIASLWDVNDDATSLLMTNFYEYLRKGWGKAEALRQSQIDLRTEHPEYAHPFYWAAFVLTGDGGDISNFRKVKNETNLSTQATATMIVSEPTAEPTPYPKNGKDVCFGTAIPLGLIILSTQWRRKPRVKKGN